jgi:hypothetical protein
VFNEQIYQLMMEPVHSYPEIRRWLRPWLVQRIIHSEDYQVLIDELENAHGYARELGLLESDIQLAAKACSEFENIIQEKAKLPPLNDEANKSILNKLSEIRAIGGLCRLGFKELRSLPAPGPDLSGLRNNQRYLIEVTRLGSSQGKRSRVWDAHETLYDGTAFGTMSQSGSAPRAIRDAIYREVEAKSRQLRTAGPGFGIVWISLGRNYFIAGKYELSGVGVMKNMRRTMAQALIGAVDDLQSTGLYTHIGHVVLSLGRDLEDLVVPQLARTR